MAPSGTAMNHLNRLAQLVGINAVPLFGVFWSDWSDATAIAFYWCETALVVAFASLRLLVHRRLTRTRGHWVEMKVTTNGSRATRRATTFNASFLVTAVAFGVGNLVFLVVMLVVGARTGGGAVDLAALGRGSLVAGAVVAAGFLFDLPGMRARPFASVRRAAEAALGRVFVVYAAVFAGAVAAVLVDRPRVLFSVFFALRVLTDLGSWIRYDAFARPPRWLGRLSEAWRAQWEKEWADEMARRAEDEEPYEGIPSRSGGTGLQIAGGWGSPES